MLLFKFGSKFDFYLSSGGRGGGGDKRGGVSPKLSFHFPITGMAFVDEMVNRSFNCGNNQNTEFIIIDKHAKPGGKNL